MTEFPDPPYTSRYLDALHPTDFTLLFIRVALLTFQEISDYPHCEIPGFSQKWRHAYCVLRLFIHNKWGSLEYWLKNIYDRDALRILLLNNPKHK